MQFFALPVLALAATSVDAARRRRTSSRYTPPSGSYTPPTGDGSYHYSSTSSQTSQATCTATVKASTESEAKAALVDVYAQIMTGYCKGFDYVDEAKMDRQLKAIARLTLESKITCTTSGKYAYACGDTWVGASSFAGAAYEAYASAWAQVSENGKCECGSKLTADADISISSFGELWAKIYAGLDDYGCAGSGNEYDDLPAAIDQDRKVECTASLIYRVWAEATAGVWVRSSCKANLESRCEECCLSPAGDYLPDCDCQEYTAQCDSYMVNWAKSVASAKINVEEVKNTAKCTGTESDLTTDIKNFTPRFEYNNTAVTDGNVRGKCLAYAETESYADAASNQASATVPLIKSICKVNENAPEIVMEDAGKIAEVIASVYNNVTTECSLGGPGAEGLDPYYDGGCAFAKTHVEAFASACAEAFAAAFTQINFGTKAEDDCDCNLSGQAIAQAMAHEVETIHAQAAQTAEAEACTEGVLRSEVARTCVAKSTAELYAKAVADILLENNCVSADKDEYCKGQCQDYNGSDGWATCIAQCEQDADASATAFADAIATITLTNAAECEAEAFSGVASFGQSFSLTPALDNP